METLNIIIVIQGLFWALLILSSRLKLIEKASLGLLMLLCVLIQFLNLIPSVLNNLNISFGFIILSLGALYTLNSISPNNESKIIKNYLFILPLIFAVSSLITVFLKNSFEYNSTIHFVLLILAFFIFIITLAKLQSFANKKQYSSHFLENTGLYISAILQLIFGILISLLLLIIILNNSGGNNLPGGNSLWLNIVVAVGMFMIGYLSINKELKSQTTSEKSHKKIVLDKHSNKQQLIKKALIQDKIHLDNDLTLDKLADYLNIDSAELSSILNHEMNTNYYHLINLHRVEEVKKKLQEDDSRFFTLLAIAFDCGFNSKSTFNRVFKEFTGKSPKEFKEGLGR